MILTLRTDKPQAEVGLYDGQAKLAYKSWQAHRQLSLTIHKVIKELLEQTGRDWEDISGIVYFKGPGSFTGLRIGAAVANTLAFGASVPVAAMNGPNWIRAGIEALAKGQHVPTVPEYGADPRTTIQKK